MIVLEIAGVAWCVIWLGACLVAAILAVIDR
jgi:hypothetical protein